MNGRENDTGTSFRRQRSSGIGHQSSTGIRRVRGFILDGGKNGAPEEIRTPDPQIRSLVLYPAELRARFSLTFQGARPTCRKHSDTIKKAAKARHSYRLWPGLARSGKRPFAVD